jgi:hypothetical protein
MSLKFAMTLKCFVYQPIFPDFMYPENVICWS